MTAEHAAAVAEVRRILQDARQQKRRANGVRRHVFIGVGVCHTCRRGDQRGRWMHVLVDGVEVAHAFHCFECIRALAVGTGRALFLTESGRALGLPKKGGNH